MSCIFKLNNLQGRLHGAGSPPTAGFLSSRLDHSMWVSWWTERSLGKFLSGFLSRFPQSQILFHHFSTLISFISFHFIRSCDGASGVVDPVLCRTQVEDKIRGTTAPTEAVSAR